MVAVLKPVHRNQLDIFGYHLSAPVWQSINIITVSSIFLILICPSEASRHLYLRQYTIYWLLNYLSAPCHIFLHKVQPTLRLTLTFDVLAQLDCPWMSMIALVLVVLSAMSKPGWHKTTLLPLGLQASLPLPSIACIYGRQSRVVWGRLCILIGVFPLG